MFLAIFKIAKNQYVQRPDFSKIRVFAKKYVTLAKKRHFRQKSSIFEIPSKPLKPLKSSILGTFDPILQTVKNPLKQSILGVFDTF